MRMYCAKQRGPAAVGDRHVVAIVFFVGGQLMLVAAVGPSCLRCTS
jgi:hypothetical protein